MFIKGSADKPEDITLVAVTVSAAATSGASSADAAIVDGKVVGIVATGNQDQFVDNVVIGSDGAVTVTLNAAATADNTFNVAVLRATGNNA